MPTQLLPSLCLNLKFANLLDFPTACLPNLTLLPLIAPYLGGGSKYQTTLLMATTKTLFRLKYMPSVHLLCGVLASDLADFVQFHSALFLQTQKLQNASVLSPLVTANSHLISRSDKDLGLIFRLIIGWHKLANRNKS